MAHFARLDNNNIVTQVIVVSDDDAPNPFPQGEAAGQQFILSLGLEGTWKQTSYNGNFRKHYAGIGYRWDELRDAFIPPQPFPSWALNEDACDWAAPVPYPDDGGQYWWDEDAASWVLADQNG
jgi:hypothetical protein